MKAEHVDGHSDVVLFPALLSLLLEKFTLKLWEMENECCAAEFGLGRSVVYSREGNGGVPVCTGLPIFFCSPYLEGHLVAHADRQAQLKPRGTLCQNAPSPFCQWLCSKATARRETTAAARKMERKEGGSCAPSGGSVILCARPHCLLYPISFCPFLSRPILEKISTLVVPTLLLHSHSTLRGPSRAQLGFFPAFTAHRLCPSHSFPSHSRSSSPPPIFLPFLSRTVHHRQPFEVGPRPLNFPLAVHSLTHTEGPLTSSQICHPLIKSPDFFHHPLPLPHPHSSLVFVCQHIFPTASALIWLFPSLNAPIPLAELPFLIPFTLVRLTYIASNLSAKSFFG